MDTPTRALCILCDRSTASAGAIVCVECAKRLASSVRGDDSVRCFWPRATLAGAQALDPAQPVCARIGSCRTPRSSNRRRPMFGSPKRWEGTRFRPVDSGPEDDNRRSRYRWNRAELVPLNSKGRRSSRPHPRRAKTLSASGPVAARRPKKPRVSTLVERKGHQPEPGAHERSKPDNHAEHHED